MPNFSSIGQEMAEILRIQRTCGGWWWWVVADANQLLIVTPDRLVIVVRPRSEAVTITHFTGLHQISSQRHLKEAKKCVVVLPLLVGAIDWHSGIYYNALISSLPKSPYYLFN